MAGGGGPPVPEGKGGKKSVDFQINLIPFIDLLSVLIAFLLMTSVWTQISKIEVRQAPNMPSDEPPEEEPEEKLNLTVVIKDSGYTVSKKKAVVKEIAKQGELYDQEGLAEVLKQVTAEHPSNREVTVTSEDKVPYKELIGVMDLLIDYKLDAISVSGVDT
ncbi:MAG TPA: biopolymer transporter ExbD [Myxococcales bacterium LLY-WYZ-16_1]|jgi:biopolymer transport protein ExbD|nr:biopolymer transporter ExbD [Myxococcales bacterium LLY-WYZ-16_1]